MAPTRRHGRSLPKKQSEGEAGNGNTLKRVEVADVKKGKTDGKGKPYGDVVESDLTETSGSVDSRESNSKNAPVAIEVGYDWNLQLQMKRIKERKEYNEKMEVRGAVNKQVWPKLKFIMDIDDELKIDGNIAKAITTQLQISESKVASFWKRNKELVYRAMNSKRNNVVKDIKRAIEMEVASGK